MTSGRRSSAPAAPAAAIRRRLRVRGVVQGVGFRPFVHRLAHELGLGGEVGNDTGGVFVEVEGDPGGVRSFEGRLVSDAPPLAHIDAIETVDVTPRGDRAFVITASRSGDTPRTFVSPDIAVCDDCRREMFDPADRRYRHPFVNCTNCGPRFSITMRLPYDRPNTTMAGFSMCPACAAEYDDPTDRRFHAQPIACPRCGPQLSFEVAGTRTTGTDAVIAAAQRALASGAILAVKGLGGYHLACDARSPTLATLRQRKQRADKPFAVMVRNLAIAHRIAHIDADEAALLQSPISPIVLVRRRASSPLDPLVAPGNPFVGVMLPYTPMHHLLFSPVPSEPDATSWVPDALVMTSGNLTDEPICYDDNDARERLTRIVDGWLVHDRPIHVPCDDSVVRLVDGHELPVRRSRGYAPLPLRLPFPVRPTLAVGGELKNTFCIARDRDAWMSQHIGDMGSVETLAAFERSTRQFRDLYGIDPEVIAADAHPGYHTSAWAAGRGAHPALVLHHHAHIAAVMAEHGVPAGERVIGFAFDGTGFGQDATIWGGEVLVASYAHAERVAHLRPVSLPGGDATIKKPYRAALAHLFAAGIEWAPDLAPVRHAGPEEQRVLARQLDRGVHCVASSSMGRLFDAVSSILDIRHTVSYEAQAAIELEAAAEKPEGDAKGLYYDLPAAAVSDPTDLLRAVVADLRDGKAVGHIAYAFHDAVARFVATTAAFVASEHGIRTVALSGGVFQNALVLRRSVHHLAKHDFTVLTHRLVPPNDGGLALGQVAIASASAGHYTGR